MINTIKVCAMVVFASVVLAQPVMARDFAEIYTDCGLGAIISPKNDAVAAVTNVTWDLGTTAISSNISCPDACVGGKGRLASFIHNSYASLERDFASGSGTYLDTLMVLAGWDSQAQQEHAEALRNDFVKIVADQNYTNKSQYEKSKSLYDLVNKHITKTA